MENKDNKLTSKPKIFDMNGSKSSFNVKIDDFLENSYFLKNSQMFETLCRAIQFKKIYTVSSWLNLPKNKVIREWIYSITLKIQNGKMIKRLYWIFNDIHDYPKCMHPDCQKHVSSDNFQTMIKGYAQYCSSKCMITSPIVKMKRKITNSTKSPEQLQEELNKRLDTFNKHKAEDPDFIKRIQEKSVATRKKNHGKDYTGRKKCRETMIKNYGVDNPMKLKEVQEKLKQHNIETYGVEWHIAAPDIREKSRQTVQENYGVDNPFAAKEIIEQIKQYNLENYGVEYNWQREDVKQHIRDTNKRLYGYESAMQNPDIRSRSMKNIKYNGQVF